MSEDKFITYLARQRAILRAKIAGLDRMERLYRECNGEVVPSYRHLSGRTHGDMILSVLADHPDGLPAKDIVAGVRSLAGMEIPRTTISPQLTRLASRGRITKSNGQWALAERSGEVVA